MRTLLQKFKWLMECPFGEVGYDSKKKTIFMGDYSDPLNSKSNAMRNIGRYRVYKLNFFFPVGRKSGKHNIYEDCDLIFVVDTETHEVGMINPFYMYEHWKQFSVEEELEKNQI